MTFRALLCAATALAASPALAAPGDPVKVSDTLTIDPIIEGRLRFEAVDQPTTDADALTMRLRAGAELKHTSGLSFLAEGEATLAVIDNYNAFPFNIADSQRRLAYSVVPDPMNVELNRLQVQYKSKAVTATVGRQRINLDDQRFVGSVGWRQNEQTFDAFSLETKVLPGATATYAYIDEVQRVFGPDSGSPQETFNSDSHILNLKLTKLPVGALTVYGYFLDFDDAPQLSANTYGARYDGSHSLGEKMKFGWALEYAQQRDAGDNQASIDADYSLIELSLKGSAVGAVVGREVLSGEPGSFTSTTNPAFQTPLATLHIWQGWADKFPTTPSAGIEDTYVGLNGSFAGFNGQAVWHDFKAEAASQDYGTELDLSVSRKFAKRYEVLVKYADYSENGLFTDTRKFWLQFGAGF